LIRTNIVLLCIIFLFASCAKKQKKIVSFDKNEKESIVLNFGKHKKKIEFTFQKINGEAERHLKQFHMSSLLRIGGIEDTIFKMPISIRTDDKNNIYVLDQLDKSVIKFDKKGQFLKKYGKYGRGPGEFLFAQGFDVFDDGKIVVADPNNNKVAVFNNQKVIEYKCRYSPLKVSFVSSSEVVIHQILEPIFTSSIRKINYVNKTITDYQNILNQNSFGDKVYGAMPFLIGDVLRYKNNYTVYTSRVLNYVVVFNSKGLIDKVFKMLDDDLDLSKVYIEKFSNKTSYLQTSVVGNELFVCKKVSKKGNTDIFVDIFSLNKGKYKYSIKLDDIKGLWAVQFSKNKMFAIKEDTEIEIFSYVIDK